MHMFNIPSLDFLKGNSESCKVLIYGDSYESFVFYNLLSAKFSNVEIKIQSRIKKEDRFDYIFYDEKEPDINYGVWFHIRSFWNKNLFQLKLLETQDKALAVIEKYIINQNPECLSVSELNTLKIRQMYRDELQEDLKHHDICLQV